MNTADKLTMNQYYVDADGGLPIFKGGELYYSNLESIIRGDEIHLGGDVHIRNAFGPDMSSSSS
ncbi:MAG TPA: hypothetical protein DCS91_03700 [Microcoleaceae bacterium UBA11344]|jgi:hypothetical protein|nr:hypothetical protein [Microcoleaceae cyanobacterium UBA11344]